MTSNSCRIMTIHGVGMFKFLLHCRRAESKDVDYETPCRDVTLSTVYEFGCKKNNSVTYETLSDDYTNGESSR